MPREYDAKDEDDLRCLAQRYGGRDFDKLKQVEHEVFAEYGGTWSLPEFQNMLSDAILQIPLSFRGGATVALESGYEGGCSLTITYIGPETQSALNERIARCWDYAIDELAKERAQYKYLKAKYEAKG